MNIKRITLCPNITFDFFHLQEESADNADIFINQYKPVLSTSSRALICFDDTYANLYNSYGVSDTALGYSFSVYRSENGSESLDYITTVSYGGLSIIDHNIRNLTSYQYHIYKEDGDYLSNVQQSNIINTNWDTWSIAEFAKVDESSEKPIYQVIGPTWILNLNVESGDNTHVFNKTLYDSLGRYPKIMSGRNNYTTGSLTAIVGRLENGKYVEDTGNVRQWAEFCGDNRLKILKDRSGDSWIVATQTLSSKVADESIEQYHTVTFNWTEVMSRYDVSIIE